MKLFFILVLLLLCTAVYASTVDLENHGPFGTLYVYPPESGTTNNVVIIVSGDGGWRGSVLSMAAMLSGQNALVVGIDIRRYLHVIELRSDDCSDASSDLVELSHFIQKKYELDSIRKPLLLGYSSGATLVYGVLAQASPDAFLGGISFGFCPDLQIRKHFCRVGSTPLARSRGLSFLPAKDLRIPWYVFQGLSDQVCNEAETEAYVRQIPAGKFVLLPAVGHGFRKTQNWMDEFRDAYRQLTHQQLELGVLAVTP